MAKFRKNRSRGFTLIELMNTNRLTPARMACLARFNVASTLAAGKWAIWSAIDSFITCARDAR